jgi:thymidine phosphorylase
LIVVELGGGRRRAQDAIDPSVGLTSMVSVGQPVMKGEPLAYVHAPDPHAAARAAGLLSQAIVIDAARPANIPVVITRVDGSEF